MNISRHSDARRFVVEVSADEKTLRVSVEDDGCGMAPGSLPPSLQRRARILRGKLEVQSPPPGAPPGTRIVLTLRRHVLVRFVPFLK